MYTNYEQNRYHRQQQQELLKEDRTISPYGITTILVALSSLVVGGLLMT